MSLPASASQTRPARPALVIDGESIVVSRRPIAGSPEARPSGDGMTAPGAAPAASASAFERADARSRREAEAGAAFGRRPPHRRPPAPDLVFQGLQAVRTPSVSPAGRDGLSVFAGIAPFGAGPRDRRAIGLAGALAVLALPLLVLSAPIGEAVATPGADPIVLDELVTSIAPRGAGAVLTVSGRIRNLSSETAAVPPLRIALAEAGGSLRSKSLATGVSSLRAGRALRFHSAVAVAKDTKGRIEVTLIATGSTGKTRSE